MQRIARDPGELGQRVDPAEPRDDVVDRRGDGGFVGDVDAEGLRLDAGRREATPDRGAIQIERRDLRAFGGERARRREPQAARRAGDHRDAAAETTGAQNDLGIPSTCCPMYERIRLLAIGAVM